MRLKSRSAAADRPLSFAGALIPGAVSAQALAAAGIDMPMIHLEHMATDGATLHAMVAATQGTGCAPLVRVPGHAPEPVKRALDMGAEGIVFPLVRDAAEAEACLAATRYPPRGVCGWGPFAAHARSGVDAHDYLPRFGERIVAGLPIETAEAVDVIDTILPSTGWTSPSSRRSTCPPRRECRTTSPRRPSPGRWREARRPHGRRMPLGAMARSPDEAAALVARGYRIVGGFDLFQLRAAAEELASWMR